MSVPEPARQLRILIVDDQPDAADAVSLLLSMMGYDVRTAYGARQALQLFREMRPHVVLLDIEMPEMSGLDTAACMRMMPAGTTATIVALTGWSEEAHRRLTREASIDYHLVKPATPEMLRDVLRRVRVVH